MSVTVRPYRHGGWDVDIVWRSPDGRRRRGRKRVTVKSRSAAHRWGQARERERRCQRCRLAKARPEPDSR